VTSDDGHEKEKKTIGEGTPFGELALMYSSPRTATITALSTCSLWVMDRRTFKSIIYQKNI